MIHVPLHDNALASLVGATLRPDGPSGAAYVIERVLGGGAMSVAFLAIRAADDGHSRVVVKVLRPALARASRGLAALSVQKETIALGRLNARVPPTPYVVRLVDAGTVATHDGTQTFALPWTALEYVHGGAEGTTLEERLATSLRTTGHAFDLERAAVAVSCLAQGIAAIHDVGVVHRDLKPANVLACGFGDDEIFKVADFGIARPVGLNATFGGLVGTPGYAAPEQMIEDDRRIGPATDVFAFGAVVYYLLTGAAYFPVTTPLEALTLAQRGERRRLLDGPGLAPDLRSRPSVCATLDAALARITAPNPSERPTSAVVAAAMLVPALRSFERGRSTGERARTRAGTTASPRSTFSFAIRHRPGDDRLVRSVAWESDGCCLVTTSQGLAFWTGISWQRLAIIGLPSPDRLHFIRRVHTGGWLLGGDSGEVHGYQDDTVSRRLVARDTTLRLALADGDVTDLAVFVGERSGEPPILLAIAAGHWVKPANLTRAASITALARLDAERWIVTGRASAGEGFAVIYTPLEWEVKRVKTPPARAYLAAATRPELGLGVIAGTDGKVVRFHGDTTQPATIEGEPSFSAVALDGEGRAWAASPGQIWTVDPGPTSAWRSVWRDPSWTAPFVSLTADVGRVIALTVDGGVLEGACEVSPRS